MGAFVSSVSSELVKELAPTGTLRAAINIGNPVLVQTDSAGTPSGVTVDLARELAKRLGVALEPIVIDGAGKSFEAVKAARCDIGFGRRLGAIGCPSNIRPPAAAGTASP